MNKKIRTLLFLILFLIFITFSPVLVLYSLGYTYDFEKKALVKTGVLFVQAKPPSVQIFLSGKFKKKTDKIFGKAKILRLKPKKYLVEIKKENYLPWKKELEIKEGKVTEVLGVILIPEKINFKEIENKKEIFLKRKQKDFIFPKKVGNFEIFLEGKDLFSFSLDKGKEKILENFLGWDEKGDKILVFSNKEIWEISFAGKTLLFRTSEEIQDAVFLTENYIVFALSGKIVILETDIRDKPNFYEIAKFENPRLAINSKNQILVLEKDKLFISDSLY